MFVSYHQICIYGYVVTYYSHTPHVHMYTYTIAHTDFPSGDYTSVSMTLGPFTSQQPRQCFNVPITNDAFIELNETFTARLTLIDSSVTTITANRIIVDPPQTTVLITDNDLSKYSTSTRSQAQTTHVYTCEGMDGWAYEISKHLALCSTSAHHLVTQLSR